MSSTGFRRKEVASLTPNSFQLDEDAPTVTIEAACSKHRREDVLPLHPDLAAMLPDWLKGRPADEPLFPSEERRNQTATEAETGGALVVCRLRESRGVVLCGRRIGELGSVRLR